MKVYTLGCSFTYGMKDHEWDTISWPEKLSVLHPELEIEDYSFPGTSIDYSLYQLYKLKDKINDSDKIVFQITLPYRFTTFDPRSIEKYRYNKRPNYRKYSEKAKNTFERYVPAKAVNLVDSNSDKKFHKYFYTKQIPELERPKVKSLCDFIVRNTDFCFVSRAYYDYFDGITVLEEEFGKEIYEKYTWDEGGHQSYLGSKAVASYISKKLGLEE